MIDAYNSSPQAARYKVVLGFLAIYLIWGSTYLAIRFAIETIPAILSAGVRFVAGGAMLYAIARMNGAVKATRVQWRNSAITGLLLVVGGTGTVTWAEQFVPSGLAALMISAMPFWMVLIEWLRPGGIRPTRGTVFGLVIGFIGIIILIGPIQMSAEGGLGVVATAALLFATLSWASGSIYSRHIDMPESRLLSVGIQMFVGGLFMIVIAGAVGEFSALDIGGISVKSLGGLAYLTLIGSLAFAAYVWLLKVSTPAKVSTYAFVNPVVAVFLGWLLGGEQISLRIILAAAIVVGAVATITISRNKKSAKVQSPNRGPASINSNAVLEDNH